MYLKGFKDYLDEKYQTSVFDTVNNFDSLWTFHLHEHRVLCGKVTQNLTYDIEFTNENSATEMIPKTQIKLLYPAESNQMIQKKIKSDSKVKKLNLQPIISARPRHHVKNKTLYVLMKERQVVFFTLLEGEIIRGLIADFARYDITVNLKGGVPITILRHSIYDIRDKKGRCYLKEMQDTKKDWKKSEFYISVDN